MDDELLPGLPEDIASQIDRRGVMREAAEHVAALHGPTTRLGDALDAAGLPGRVWRSDDAVLSLLDEALPDVTVDALITRLAEFSADTGPAWLHGNRDDLEAFHDEVAILRDTVRPLRLIAQRLRLGTAGRVAEWPIERAFASARAATPLDMIAAILRDLELLAPVMEPLSAEEWDLPPEAEQAQSEASAPPWLERRMAARGDNGADPAAPQRATRQAGWGQRLVPWILTHRLAATAGLVLVLVTGVGLLQVAERHVPAPASVHQTATVAAPALVASPGQLALVCAGRSATLTLKNAGTQPLAWQAQPVGGLSIVPARGTLPAGQSAEVRVAAPGRHAGNGTIVITAANRTVAIPYTITCGHPGG